MDCVVRNMDAIDTTAHRDFIGLEKPLDSLMERTNLSLPAPSPPSLSPMKSRSSICVLLHFRIDCILWLQSCIAPLYQKN